MLQCENILLDKDYDIRLSDFGFAATVNENVCLKGMSSVTQCLVEAVSWVSVLRIPLISEYGGNLARQITAGNEGSS